MIRNIPLIGKMFTNGHLKRGSFQDSTNTVNIQLKQFCFSHRKSNVFYRAH